MKNTLKILSDIIKLPFLNAWLVLVSKRIPILPGQIWNVPGVGFVLIRMTDNQSIYYTSLESSFYEYSSEIILRASRVEFLIHSTKYSGVKENEENQNDEKEKNDQNILNLFDFKRKKDDDNNEH